MITKVMIQGKTPRKVVKAVSTVWPWQQLLPIQNRDFAAEGIFFSRTRLVIPSVLEKAFYRGCMKATGKCKIKIKSYIHFALISDERWYWGTCKNLSSNKMLQDKEPHIKNREKLFLWNKLNMEFFILAGYVQLLLYYFLILEIASLDDIKV